MQSRVQEARTGALVWARARDTKVELLLVAESDTQRFTPGARLTISREKDSLFGDTPALMDKASRRKKWLLPAGLNWR